MSIDIKVSKKIKSVKSTVIRQMAAKADANSKYVFTIEYPYRGTPDSIQKQIDANRHKIDAALNGDARVIIRCVLDGYNELDTYIEVEVDYDEVTLKSYGDYKVDGKSLSFTPINDDDEEEDIDEYASDFEDILDDTLSDALYDMCKGIADEYKEYGLKPERDWEV